MIFWCKSASAFVDFHREPQAYAYIWTDKVHAAGSLHFNEEVLNKPTFIV